MRVVVAGGFVLERVVGVTLVLAGSLSLTSDLSRHRAAWLLLARH